MKTTISFLVMMMVSLTSQAGLVDFNSKEFNAMINENNKSRQEIQKEYQKTLPQQAKVDKDLAPLEVSSEEVIVVETSKAEYFEHSRIPAKVDKLNRVAEELEAAQ